MALLRRKVDNTNCCVYGCHTIRMKENASFHLFPRKDSHRVLITNAFGIQESVPRRKAWELALNMEKPATNYMRVCGKHFKKEDYLYEFSRKPSLKLTAVPSQSLPCTSFRGSKKRAVVEQRQERKRKRQMPQEQNCGGHQEDSVTVSLTEQDSDPVQHTFDELNHMERSAVGDLLHLPSGCTEEQSKNIQNVEKAVQVTSGDLFRSFSSIMTSDTRLNSFTGIPNFKILGTITSLVSKYYGTTRSQKLSVEDSIILVFIKLKLAIKFRVLANFFEISPSTCRLLFNEYVQYTANVLQPCIYWPTIDECRANLPNCFKDFPSLRLVLDCMEIPLQKPKRKCCRIKTYSHYKGRHILKFITGVSPGGLITFVSECYGGHASDKAIFQQSGVVEKLTSHIDSIMVDKAFAIADICNEYFIKIVQPHFLRKKKQFTGSEAKTNIRVSRARVVHVERAHQRIRLFEIFNSPLPWNMVPYIDDIVTIACAIVNLQPPILAEAEFN